MDGSSDNMVPNTRYKSSHSHQAHQGIQTCTEDTIKGKTIDDKVCSRNPNLIKLAPHFHDKLISNISISVTHR